MSPMNASTGSYFAAPSPAALGFFASEIAGDITRGALPPTLASARLNASCLAGAGLEDACGCPVSLPALLDEIDALATRYGEDCPVSELVSDPRPYTLAARVLPSAYRRIAIDVTLKDVFDAAPGALAGWLGARSEGAGELADVRIRLLAHAGILLRLEITGESLAAADAEVENPMVPSEEVPLDAGCEPADIPRYCGYSAGGFTRLCPRCLAVHEAERELLSTY